MGPRGEFRRRISPALHAKRSTLRRVPAVALFLVAGWSAALATPARASWHSLSVRVLASRSRSIPPSFLGLSVEVNELQSYLRNGAAFDRAISLLRPTAGGPVNLRVGGKSADDAYWDSSPAGAPPWVFGINDGWLGRLAALARRDQLHVTLGLNLAVHSPAMAASFASAALEALGPSDLAGLAIGNEPDLFRFQPGLDRERVATTAANRRSPWTNDYSASAYRADYVAYAHALAKAVPGVPLVGPEITKPDSRWLRVLTNLGALRPAVLTVHRYPFSSCWPTTSFVYPRFSSMLAERASAGLAKSLAPAIRNARKAGIPFWLSEVNSASCGGKFGVTNTFATALWAPDVLFELVHSGVQGVNWHLRPGLPNAPLLLRGEGIQPLPELYGLALFARMMGPGARLEQVRTSSQRGLHLKIWAVGSAQGLSVLLINKGVREAHVSLRAGLRGSASVQRLSAPSIQSVSGVRLGGQWIGHDARWHGREVRELIRPIGRSYRVPVPHDGAALVQIAPARSTPSAAPGAARQPHFPIPASYIGRRR